MERDVAEQLGGSDHRPVNLTVSRKVNAEPAYPRWNYKTAKWGLYRHRTSTLVKNLQVKGRDINHVVKEFNDCILKAAH